VTGAQRIASERERQQAKLGWTVEHDAEHDDGSLAMAAVCYAAQAADGRFYGEGGERGNVLRNPPNDAFRIRLLEKAGALIAAEIDRLLASEPEPAPSGESK
jgi:hypothetical protein